MSSCTKGIALSAFSQTWWRRGLMLSVKVEASKNVHIHMLNGWEGLTVCWKAVVEVSGRKEAVLRKVKHISIILCLLSSNPAAFPPCLSPIPSPQITLCTGFFSYTKPQFLKGCLTCKKQSMLWKYILIIQSLSSLSRLFHTSGTLLKMPKLIYQCGITWNTLE